MTLAEREYYKGKISVRGGSAYGGKINNFERKNMPSRKVVPGFQDPSFTEGEAAFVAEKRASKTGQDLEESVAQESLRRDTMDTKGMKTWRGRIQKLYQDTAEIYGSFKAFVTNGIPPPEGHAASLIQQELIYKDGTKTGGYGLRPWQLRDQIATELQAGAFENRDTGT